jgi:hypothetical protein
VNHRIVHDRLFVAAWLAVLLSSLLPPSRGEAAPGKRYALLVGVREYRHAKLPDLKYTENDIEELAALLRQPGAGFRDPVVLTSSRAASRPAALPTAANIRAELKRILGGVTKHDTVLVALAGHGVQLRVKGPAGKETDEAFFCPADARLTSSTDPRELNKTLLSLNELFIQLEDSGAGMKLLLVDACRNDPQLGRSLDADALPHPPRGTAALFSCSSGQRAFETPKLGKGHGVFFHYVLEGLKGEAKNRDGEVTWDDLTTYVKRQVPRAVPRLIGSGARQEPHLVANITGEPPVLSRIARRPVRPAWVLERAFGNGAALKVAPPKGGYWLNRVAFTPDGKYCVATGGGLILFDLATGKELRRILEVRGARPGLALSRDGSHCLTGHAANPIAHLVEVPSFKIVGSFPGHTGGVTAVALSPDGTEAATAGSDGLVRLWNVRSHKELHRINGFAARVRCLAFSPDGKRLLAGLDAASNSAGVEVVDVHSARRVASLRGHTATVMAVAFVPAGNHFVSASLDGTLRLWDLATGKQLWRSEHKGGIHDLAVSPDGRQVLTAGFGDRQVRLWNRENGAPLHVFPAHLASVLGVSFARDGRRALSSDTVSCARLWKALP